MKIYYYLDNFDNTKSLLISHYCYYHTALIVTFNDCKIFHNSLPYQSIVHITVPEPRDSNWSGHYRLLVVLLEYCADCSIRVSRSLYTSSWKWSSQCLQIHSYGDKIYAAIANWNYASIDTRIQIICFISMLKLMMPTATHWVASLDNWASQSSHYQHSNCVQNQIFWLTKIHLDCLI